MFSGDSDSRFQIRSIRRDACGKCDSEQSTTHGIRYRGEVLEIVDDADVTSLLPKALDHLKNFI
jgi:hypothetical protein